MKVRQELEPSTASIRGNEACSQDKSHHFMASAPACLSFSRIRGEKSSPRVGGVKFPASRRSRISPRDFADFFFLRLWNGPDMIKIF